MNTNIHDPTFWEVQRVHTPTSAESNARKWASNADTPDYIFLNNFFINQVQLIIKDINFITIQKRELIEKALRIERNKLQQYARVRH